jgi:hypothetical protein
LKRALSLVAFAGFFMSLLVHVTTFFGIDPSKHVPFVWALHLGIFVVFIPMVIYQRPKLRKNNWRIFIDAVPRWARYAVKGFFAYALINFALFFYLSGGGVPEVRDGRYVLHNHGKVIRELSEDEYELQNAYVLRGFSGHWMLFYLIPALFFWYRVPEDSPPPGDEVGSHSS